VPEPFDSTSEFMKDDIFAQSLQDLGAEQAVTEDLVSQELNKALQGIHHHLDNEDLENIVVMAIDAATSGRLAIVYYQQISAYLFYKAILEWHMSCSWLQTYKDESTNKTRSYVGTPSTYRIAEAVYGSK